MSKKKPIKFTELRQTQIPLLSELINETFVINGFSKADTPLGAKCTLETDKGIFATFSEVLEQQLQFMQDQNAFPVEVTLRQKKRYHTFE